MTCHWRLVSAFIIISLIFIALSHAVGHSIKIESWAHFSTDQLFNMQAIAIDEKRTHMRIIAGGLWKKKRGAREFMVDREKKGE